MIINLENCSRVLTDEEVQILSLCQDFQGKDVWVHIYGNAIPECCLSILDEESCEDMGIDFEEATFKFNNFEMSNLNISICDGSLRFKGVDESSERWFNLSDIKKIFIDNCGQLELWLAMNGEHRIIIEPEFEC